MPRGIENLFTGNSATLPKSPSRKADPQAAGDQPPESFEKVLRHAKTAEQEPSKRSDSSSSPDKPPVRPTKPGKKENQPQDVESQNAQQPQPADQQPPTAAAEDDAQPADAAQPSAKETKLGVPISSEETGDDASVNPLIVPNEAVVQQPAASDQTQTTETEPAKQLAASAVAPHAKATVTLAQPKQAKAKPKPADLEQSAPSLESEEEIAIAAKDAEEPVIRHDDDKPANQPAAKSPAVPPILRAAEPEPDTKPILAKKPQQNPILADFSEQLADISAPDAAAAGNGDDDSITPSRTLQSPSIASTSIIEATLSKPSPTPPVAQPAASPTPAAPPEADFASTNHDRIVSSVRTQLLPNGGTMHLRLDPPELGVLQVTVRMVDGAMTASFETSNDQATKLLSHSLGDLKTVLESQGVSVEKLQVQQSPRDHENSPGGEQRQQPQEDSLARREQQRRELLNRMWRRLRLGNDPLDMVA